jgi:hypothetical protein
MKSLSPLLVATLVATAPTPAHAADLAPDAKAAFAELKRLTGDWEGTVMKPDGPATKVTYRVTANGHTLVETLFPGTPHEMISMYHLDQGKLVLTHYCALGNQPRMAFDPARSSVKELVFDFTGGTNLDPAKDTHVHAGRVRFPEADRLEAEWYVFSGGQVAGTNSFFLKRHRP